jgi:hypothetical protein
VKRFVQYSWYRHHALVITHVLLAIGVVLALLGTIKTSRDTHQLASDTHRAVCTLRADLVQRVESAQKFLINHPGGFAGVSRKDILISLRNQQRTIKSLESAHCETTPPER